MASVGFIVLSSHRNAYIVGKRNRVTRVPCCPGWLTARKACPLLAGETLPGPAKYFRAHGVTAAALERGHGAFSGQRLLQDGFEHQVRVF